MELGAKHAGELGSRGAGKAGKLTSREKLGWGPAQSLGCSVAKVDTRHENAHKGRTTIWGRPGGFRGLHPTNESRTAACLMPVSLPHHFRFYSFLSSGPLLRSLLDGRKDTRRPPPPLCLSSLSSAHACTQNSIHTFRPRSDQELPTTTGSHKSLVRAFPLPSPHLLLHSLPKHCGRRGGGSSCSSSSICSGSGPHRAAKWSDP